MSERTAADRPNILLILADDMGFSDIGCYGSEIRYFHPKPMLHDDQVISVADEDGYCVWDEWAQRCGVAAWPLPDQTWQPRMHTRHGRVV